jgi:hypothetical protein
MQFVVKENKPEIEFGDVLVGENGLYYLVVNGTDEKYPVRLINLADGTSVNGYNRIEHLRKNGYILNAVRIVRVIKNADLELREVGA